MSEPTKEQRLAELLKNPPPQHTPHDLPTTRSRMEARDLGEAVGHRKCASMQCDEFANLHPILIRGTETVAYSVDGKGTISDKVENSWASWEPVDPEDAICKSCGRNWGCLPPGARSVLDGVLNPVYGISNDREAVIVARKSKNLPLPKWAVEEANREVQKAVKKS